MIDLTLAQAVVTDIAHAEAWYEKALGTPPDSRPMDGLIEWRFGPAHGLQVFQDAERAGASTVVLGVSDLDEAMARLDRERIEHGGVQPGGGGRLITMTDPDGNQLVLLDADAAHGPTSEETPRG